MKILLYTPTFQSVTHGPAKFAQYLMQINSLFPEHEIRIMTAGIDEEVPNTIYKRIPKHPRLIHAFWPFLDNFFYYKSAKKIYKDYPFDVLVFNNALVGFWSAFKFPNSIKTVGLINDDEYLGTSLKTFSLTKKWLIDIHRKPLEKIATNQLERVATCSNYLRSKVIETYGCHQSKVKNLYQSIDFSNLPFKPERQLQKESIIEILFVKSDFLRGGLFVLIAALELLKDYFFRLVVLGPKMKLASQLAKISRETINVEIILKGQTPQKHVLEKMYEADIFCIPSLREGLGVANIEALATGIPVVSTNTGGIPEVLNYGANGWLCKPNNPKDLADTIEQCINSPEERKKRSVAGRKFVEEHFNHLKMLENFIQILSELIPK